MARNTDDYLEALKVHMPRGAIWNLDVGSILTQVLHGEADEFARIDARADDVLLESSVLTTTTELIGEHERDFGLPEEGDELGATLQERRDTLYTKLLVVGQQDKGYFIDLAAAEGITISITEGNVSWCGNFPCGNAIGNQLNLFYWLIVPETGTISDFLLGLFNRLKPAHTVLVYGPGYTDGFSDGFRSADLDNSAYTNGFNNGVGGGFA